MKDKPEKEARIRVLLEICKKHQGEHRFAHHGPGSWATTYSTEFLNASAEIFYLLEGNQRYLEFQMSQLFRKNGIRSCRQAEMTLPRVKYLYNTHLNDLMGEIDRRYKTSKN